MLCNFHPGLYVLFSFIIFQLLHLIVCVVYNVSRAAGFISSKLFIIWSDVAACKLQINTADNHPHINRLLCTRPKDSVFLGKSISSSANLMRKWIFGKIKLVPSGTNNRTKLPDETNHSHFILTRILNILLLDVASVNVNLRSNPPEAPRVSGCSRCVSFNGWRTGKKATMTK